MKLTGHDGNLEVRPQTQMVVVAGAERVYIHKLRPTEQFGVLLKPICLSVIIKKWCRAAEDCYKDLQLLMDEVVW